METKDVFTRNPDTEEFVVQEIVRAHPLRNADNKIENKIISKINSRFGTSKKRMFVNNFYCFVRYSRTRDYVVDFDMIWNQCGFLNKANAKRLLLKHFVEDNNYVINFEESSGRGRKSEKIMLNVDTFKQFCFLSQTPEANEIRMYYLDLENVVFESIEENVVERIEYEKRTIRDQEDELLFAHRKDSLVYMGLVENDVIKFGYTNGGLRDRVSCHKRDFDSFDLKKIVKTEYSSDLEKMIKDRLRDRVIEKKYKDKKQTELVRLGEDFTLTDFFRKVVEMNEELIEIRKHKSSKTILRLRENNKQLKNEIRKLKSGWKKLKKDLDRNEYDYDEFAIHFEKHVDPKKKLSIFLEFMDELYESNSETEQWFSNWDIYDEYRNYVEERSHKYAYTFRQFCNELLKFEECIKSKSRTSGDRAPGKIIRFDDKFVEHVENARTGIMQSSPAEM